MKNRLYLVTVLPLTIAIFGCNNTRQPGEPAGKEDVSFLHDHGAPSNELGNDYDHYYDEDSKYVYEKRDGSWRNLFTIGSSSLIQSPIKRAKRASTNDLNVLKNALVNTLYSSNYSCILSPVVENMDSYFAEVVQVDKEFTHLSSLYDGELHEGYYGKIDEEGNAYVYSGDSYERLEDGSNYYCELPFPTLENILFQNFLIIDDNLGQLTSIVCSELSNLKEVDGYYQMDKRMIHHSAIKSHYFSEPKEDDIEISYKFKLDENNDFLDEAEFYFNSELLKGYGYNTIHYKFSDIRTTSFDHPE